MAMSANDVLKMLKDKEVKFVDIRFTDTRGKEQHVSVPARYFTMEKFEEGHGWTFHGHEVVGGRMVPKIFAQLKLLVVKARYAECQEVNLPVSIIVQLAQLLEFL